MREFASFSEKRDWIETILIKINEGEAQAEEVEALRTLLSSDREARLFYLKSNQLDFMLTSMSEELATSEVVTRFNRSHIRLSHFLSGLIGAGIVASITLVAWFFVQNSVLFQSRPVPQEPLANVVAEHEAVFEDADPSKHKNLNEGAVSLDRGIAEIAFRNGARIVLEGKCGFEIVDSMTIILNYGKLWAHCPPEAYGFRVLTPGDHEIIDLGTEFAVEVGESGETDVHVFDGLVKVKKQSLPESRKIEAGVALNWLSSAQSSEFSTANIGPADASRFVSANTLNQRRSENYSATMSKRGDLILHYDFSQLEDDTVVNQASNAMPGSAGQLNDATIPVSGRFEDDRALLFDRPGSALDVDLSSIGTMESFTLAMWVNADRLENRLNALLNSNGWEPGDTHMQVTRYGALRLGVHGIGDFQTEVGLVKPGKWQLIAVTWNSNERDAHFFCDGRGYPALPFRPEAQLLIEGLQPEFGECRIGSWNNQGLLNPAGVERDFKGRIDEVMLFNRVLSEKELGGLYRLGKPGF